METKPSVNKAGRYKLKHRGVECLNCRHPLDLSDKYCPECSQANSTKKLTLNDFFEEFFSNIISYDSKLLKTLAALLLRPGRITHDYIAGKRVSYTNPFRFLLSLAIIYFLLMSYNSEFESLNRYGSGNKMPVFDLSSQINNIEFDSEEEKKVALAAIDSIRYQNFIGNKLSTSDSTILANPKNHFKQIEEPGFFKRYIAKTEFFTTVIKNDTVYSFQESINKYEIPSTTENKLSYNFANSLVEIERRPGTFFESVLTKLPFSTFFFLPVFAIFIWLIYIRKKYTYTDHLIFSFHNQSLFFILLIISSLIDTIFGTASSGIFLLIFSFYLYKAMRNFYKQGRFKTIVKYLFLNTIFVILASIGVVLLLAGSIFTY